MRSNAAGRAAGHAVAASPGAADAQADAAAASRPGALARSHERFIPVTRHDLLARLIGAQGWQGEEARVWRRALHCLSAWRHQYYRDRLMVLLQSYLPFSPDADTVRLNDLAPEQQARAKTALIAGIENLLERANYTCMSEADLDRLLTERSPYGLHLEVDTSEYEEMLLYYRGSDVETRAQRNPWRLYLSQIEYELPTFKRLFLLVKLKSAAARIEEIMQAEGIGRDKAEKLLKRRRAHLPPKVSSDYVYLKIFKRIPQIDLEMLFPNTKVAFKPFDKIKLGLTAGGGTVAGVVGSVTKLMAATNPFALAGALMALAGVIFRQATKFFHTRNRYMMELAQNLYFHNLANNRGALTLLADRAEEEDVKEDMLLYAHMVGEPVRPGGIETIDRRIETFLREACGVVVDFEAEDALGRLRDYGLVETGADGSLRALPPQEASRHLDDLWDRLLDEDYVDAAADRAARA